MDVPHRSPLVLALQHPFVGMVSLALLMLFAGLGQGDVRVEGAVYAWVSKWMVVSGDWLNLYYDRGQTPYFNRPPLQFWLMGISYKLFGINTWAAKLITPIFGLLCVVLTYAIARSRYSPALSATAGIILTLTYTFFRHAVGVRLEPGVAFFTLAALWCALAIGRGGRGSGLLLWLLMGTAWGLGMMLKGPVVLLAAIITLITYAWLRRWDLLLNWRWVPAAATCLAIWAPWHLQQYQTYGNAFTDAYFGRGAGSVEAGDPGGERVWFFAYQLITDYWPWLPLAAAGIYLLTRKARRQPEATVRLLVTWIGVWLLVAHLAPYKHDRYLIPWYPAVSIAAAYALSRTRLWPHWRTWVLPNVAVVALILLVLLEVFNVQLHRLDSPAVRAAAGAIREQVRAAAGAGESTPVIYVSGIDAGPQCRLRFYTDAEVVAEDEAFHWSEVPRGQFIAIPPDSPLHGRLPNVLPLAEDSRIAIYRVIGAEGGGLLR